MDKKRVYEWAKEMGMPSKQMLKELKSLGIDTKSHMSFLGEDKVSLLLEHVTKEKKPVRERKARKEKLPEEKKLPGERKAPKKKKAGAKKKELKKLKSRAPVITIMGHVDHGKTTLLDAIKESNIVAREAGEITQHIGAYEVNLKKGKVVFLDTPGHEAFTALRARGTQVTDVVVLVIAADEGVMPQTMEAIDHARAAKVPMVIAINKVDKKEANPEKVKRQLAEQNLNPEEWGGETICVEVSAMEKTGVERLLEMLLLEAEMLELGADPQGQTRGTVIETGLDKGKGPVATVLVQSGTLRVGDALVTGLYSGKVRAMINDQGERVKEAGPSVPVEISGLSGIPQAGEKFEVVTSENEARGIVAERKEMGRTEEGETHHITLEELHDRIEKGELKELRIVLKTDVQGSLEALRHSLERLGNEQVSLKVIHGAVGGITETDVILASASDALLIGFNVKPDANAQKVAKYEEVNLRTYQIIYEVISDIESALEGMWEPEIKEVILGKAEVREVFKVSKVGRIAGSYVSEGKILENARARVLREGETVYEGKIASLKRFKEDAREVQSGLECGISLENFKDIRDGDIIEVYSRETVSREAVG